MDDPKSQGGKRIEIEAEEPERLPAGDADDVGEVSEPGEDRAEKETPAEEVEEDQAETKDLVAEIERLTELYEQERDGHLRAAAELQNFKRRSAREQAERLQFANQQLIAGLLPILDNLERVLACDSETSSVEDVAKGVELVVQELHRVLESFGVERIEAEGELFDPSIHEAVALVEGDDAAAEGTIVHVDAPGYRLHGRVLRPARVVVVRGPSEQS